MKRLDSQIDDDERLKVAHFWYDTEAPFEENSKKIDKKLQELVSKGVLRDLQKII